MAQTDAVIRFTVGVPGAGKSYSRVKWLIDYFIPEEAGDIYTNLPLNKDKIIKYFVDEKGYDGKILEQRINIFPDELIKKWKKLDSVGCPPKNPDFVPYAEGINEDDLDYSELQYEFVGPWLYFQNKNLTGAHIQFDEIQKFVDIKASRKLKTVWGDWLSTIRHEGCTIEFITQRERRVAKEIAEIAETRLDIIPSGGKRFKFLPILNSDYYNLFKGLCGLDLKTSTEVESRANYGGKVIKEHQRKFRFNPFYYYFYNTSNNEETDKKTERKKEPWEIYTQFGILKWFLKRNWHYSILACIYAVALYFVLSFSGVRNLQKSFTEFFSGTEIERLEDAAKKKGMSLEAYKRFLIIQEIKKDYDKDFKDFVKLQDQKIANSLSELKLKLNSFETRLQSGPEQLTDLGTVKTKEELKEEAVERQKSDFNLVFIPQSEDYAILKNGIELKVGSVFKKGVFKGREVINISFSDRKVFLNNGEELIFE